MNYIIPGLVIALSFLILSCSHTDTNGIPEQTLYLEPFFKNVPEEDEYIFTHLFNLSTDNNGNIYVSDVIERRIMSYTPDGTFRVKVAGRGRGPGEVDFVQAMKIGDNNILYVVDVSTQRVSLFDTTGTLLDSFNFEGSFVSDVALGPDGEIAIIAPAMHEPLVVVYDRNGERIRTIGETEPLGNIWFPDQPTPVITGNKNMGFIGFNSQGELIVVYRMRPVLQIYSPDGSLLIEKELTSAEIDSLRDREYQEYERAREQSGRIPNLLAGIDYFNGLQMLDDDTFLVSLSYRRILKQIDRNGNILKIYRIINDEEKTGIDRFSIGEIAVTPAGELLVLDPYTNATVFKLIEK